MESFKIQFGKKERLKLVAAAMKIDVTEREEPDLWIVENRKKIIRYNPYQNQAQCMAIIEAFPLQCSDLIKKEWWDGVDTAGVYESSDNLRAAIVDGIAQYWHDMHETAGV